MFEDVSTFDAENPIVGSLLRELDLKKKRTDSDFIKILPSQLGEEFEIKIRLDTLKDITLFPKDNSSNNNNDSNNGAPPPVRPISPPFIDPRPPPPPPPPGPGPSGFNPFQPPLPDPFPSRGRFDPPQFNNFGNLNFRAQPSSFDRTHVRSQPTSNLFGSQTATKRQKEYLAPQDDVSV